MPVVIQIKGVFGVDVQKVAKILSQMRTSLKKEAENVSKLGITYSPYYTDYLSAIDENIGRFLDTARRFNAEQEIVVLGNGVKGEITRKQLATQYLSTPLFKSVEALAKKGRGKKGG